MPTQADQFRPEEAKLEITMSKKGEIEITGNRLGLTSLSQICASLAQCIGEPGNHYHFMEGEGFWGTEPGSIPLVIYGEDL